MPKNDDFLKEYFKESQARMRQTSDVEFRLLQFLLLTYPIIGVVIVTLYGDITETGSLLDRTTFWRVCIGAAVSLFVITALITFKIHDMHKTYNRIGRAVRKVWRYYQLEQADIYLEGEWIVQPEEVTTVPSKGYGAGKGYFWTIFILWAMASPMIILSIVLGVTAK